MNPLPDKIAEGALGEIFVQLKLLQYGVQAAPPIKDSGNDLIAVRGEVFKAIQVKTTVKDNFRVRRKKLPKRYHLLALVRLVGEDGEVDWTKSRIYLLPKSEVKKECFTEKELDEHSLSDHLLDKIFDENEPSGYPRGGLESYPFDV